MNDIGMFLFRHFEKGLLGVFFIALAYSLIAFGPWRGREDFSGELADLGVKLQDMKLVQPEDMPPVPDLAAKYSEEGQVAAQKPLKNPMLWAISPEQLAVDILPPADVVCKPERGFIAVNWQINTNQPDIASTIQFVGVEVDRALVTPEGTGPFESRTRVGDREYMVPVELYAIAKSVASITIQQAPKKTQATTKGPARPTATAPYTIEDLFNALHDGVINETQLRSLVQTGIRKGYYTSEDSIIVREILMGLSRGGVQGTRDVDRDQMVRDRRGTAGTRTAPAPAPRRVVSKEERLKVALEAAGFPGGGKYSAQAAAVEAAAPTAGTAAEEAAQPAPGPAPEAAPEFTDVMTFVDTSVNPDLDYVYKVRFWALDASGPNPVLRETGYSPTTPQVAPKPNTEFYLAGIAQGEGKASIVVRKWLYSSNNWETRSYLVAPGEEIGRVEVLPKKDTHGQMVLEGNRVVNEPVDFSTGCVLLGYRMRPRTIENTVTTTAIDPQTMDVLAVDNVEYVLYDTPQIVYADRKGKLHIKWRAPEEAG